MDKDLYGNVLGRLVGHAGKAFAQRLEKDLIAGEFGLVAPQVVLLLHIEEAEGINQQALTNHMLRDKTAITRWIDSLEKKNLVVRVPDKADRRQNMIYLTEKGKEIVPELLEMVRKIEAEAVKGMSTEEIITLKDGLRKVQRNLTE